MGLVGASWLDAAALILTIALCLWMAKRLVWALAGLRDSPKVCQGSSANRANHCKVLAT
jgi:hypothetical protein